MREELSVGEVKWRKSLVREESSGEEFNWRQSVGMLIMEEFS